jgi:predicted helicase
VLSFGIIYRVDGQPLGERNPKGLQDDYVKFIRFAQWRIERTGYGILAFITNHGYLDNPTFRGMRESLMQSFDDIYVLDLHGNAKKKERAPDGTKDENVFDIQQGVSINILVKRGIKFSTSSEAIIHHADLWGLREVYETNSNRDEQRLIGGKYLWLNENDLSTTKWTTITPTSPFYLFVPQNTNLLKEYEQCWKITEIFPLNSAGLYTARDALAIHWRGDDVWDTITNFSSLPPEEARIKYNLGDDSRDWQVMLAQKDIKKSGPSKSNITPILYRPFDIRYTYYTGNSRGFICMPRERLMRNMLKGRNKGIITVRKAPPTSQCNYFMVTTEIISTGVIRSDNQSIDYLFPLYLYNEDAEKDLWKLVDEDNVSEVPHNNLSTVFVSEFSKRLGMEFIEKGHGDFIVTFGPEGVFNYIYAIFYSQIYRERYSEFLKRDFPRLPLTSNPDLFRELCAIGDRLVKLHLMEQYGEHMSNYPEPGNNMVEKVEYTQPTDKPEQGQIWINKTQYFDGVPAEVWEFHIGGYQVCHKWLKDRKGRTLSYDERKHYQRIVAALSETITLMEQIDEAVDEHGGWPIE